MFILTNQKIDVSEYLKQIQDPSCGAYVAFEGWVRNHHEGQNVFYLEYEAVAELCEREADNIIKDAYQHFGISHAIIIHRVGRVEIGELSVWIGVTASHRDEAFKACRYLIDEIKKRLPIWKKEFFNDGTSQWVNNSPPATALRQDLRVPKDQDYYSRQLRLPEIGKNGQDLLEKTKVLVIGAGGLGCAALTSLAQAGVGKIGICEADTLDISNLHRQSLYRFPDVGQKKSELAVARLQELNPFIKLEIFDGRLTSDNAVKIISDYDYLVDATDNFATKFLLNDAAFLYHKVLVHASVYQFEGQLRVYDPQHPGACLRCLWPQVPEQTCISNCTQAGVIGIVPNILGHMQAWEVIKHALNWPDRLVNQTLLFDFKTLSLTKIKESRHPSCPLCGNQRTITTLEKAMSPNPETNPTINLNELPANNFKDYTFIDIREESELMMNPVTQVKAVHLPFSEFGSWSFEFESHKKYLIFCAHGMRSMNCVDRLRKQGIKNVQSVNEGAEAVQYYAPTK